MSVLLYFLIALVGTPTAMYLAQSSAPDEFTLNSSTYVPDEVWNAKYPRVVERMNDAAVFMDSSTTTVFSSPECTQYFFEFTPVISGSPDFTIFFRTTRTDFSRRGDKGIEVAFRNDSMIVLDGSKRYVATGVSWQGKPERLLLVNFSKEWYIMKGCTELARGISDRPATDGIVIQTSAHTAIRATDIVRNLAWKWWDKQNMSGTSGEESWQERNMFGTPRFPFIR
jgi:hypothetical protein